MEPVLVVAAALLAVVVLLRLVHRRAGDRPELSPALVGMLAGGPKHAGPKAIRGHRTSIEAFDILRRKLVRAGLLLPTPSWLLVRVLPVAVVVLCVVGLIDGGDSNSSDYEDVRLEHPSVPLNADPNR